MHNSQKKTGYAVVIYAENETEAMSLAGSNLGKSVTVLLDNGIVPAVLHRFLPPVKTTVERNDMPTPRRGEVIYNSDTDSLEFYSISGWTQV